LFVARARAIHSDFALVDANAAAVADVCRRLDGLPLAIELAAARSRVLPPAALLARLERRLPLLTHGARDLPDRQRTLTGAIAWSYDLLTPVERRLFQQISVFSGGMSLEAVETVCEGAAEADPLTLLASLVDKSLVRQTEIANGEPRFGMLETIREFALTQLQAAGDEAPVRSRHAAWCLALLEQAEAAYSGPDEAAWLERLDRERDNLRGALEAMLAADDGEMALRLAVALWPFWTRRGLLREGRRWLLRALDAGSAAPAALRATALYRLGSLAIDFGNYEQASGLYAESRRLAEAAGDERAVARALTGLGIVATDTGAVEEATAHYRAALAIWERLGDPRELARVHFNLGYLASMTGEAADAITHHRQALELRQSADADTADLGYSFFGLGQAIRRAGQEAEARKLIAQARRIFESLADPLGLAYAQLEEGRSCLAQGHVDEAARALAEAITSWHAMGDRIGVIEAIEALSLTAWRQHDPDRAATLLDAATAWRRRIGVATPPAERPALDALRDALARQGHRVRSHADDLPAPSFEQLVLKATEAIHRTSGDAR
jgi:tetratricopeptide (TPR) repeat protein